MLVVLVVYYFVFFYENLLIQIHFHMYFGILFYFQIKSQLLVMYLQDVKSYIRALLTHELVKVFRLNSAVESIFTNAKTTFCSLLTEHSKPMIAFID